MDAPIGEARMRPDGTLELRLRAEGPDGMAGDAFMLIAPDDPRHAEWLAHLGPLEPGGSALVRPWR